MNIEERIATLRQSFIENFSRPNTVYLGYKELDELKLSRRIKVTDNGILAYECLKIVPVAIENHLTLGFVVHERVKNV